MGIEIDFVAGSLRLPAEKLHRLESTIENWGDRKVCTHKELESLIGQLNHTCKVVCPGRTFHRRMIDLLTATRPGTSHRPHHHIRLNQEFRADLAWWCQFLLPWNGVGVVEASNSSPSIKFTSNASGSWGCGAWHGVRWFQHPWSETKQRLAISTKELFLIVVAAAIWGSEWKGAYQLRESRPVNILRWRGSDSPSHLHCWTSCVLIGRKPSIPTSLFCGPRLPSALPGSSAWASCFRCQRISLPSTQGV